MLVQKDNHMNKRREEERERERERKKGERERETMYSGVPIRTVVVMSCFFAIPKSVV